MKSHLLIELAKTERAIAEGLRSLEELNQAPELTKAGSNHSSQMSQDLTTLRQKQRAIVNRRNKLLRELERSVSAREDAT
jgi:hypothetical protein